MSILSRKPIHVNFKKISEGYDVKVDVHGCGDYGVDPIVRRPSQDGSFTAISEWELADGLKACIENVGYMGEDCDLDDLIDESTKYIKNEIEIVSDIASTTSTPSYGTYHVMLEVQPKYYYKSFSVEIYLKKDFSPNAGKGQTITIRR